MKYAPPKNTDISLPQAELKIGADFPATSLFLKLNKSVYDIDFMRRETPLDFIFSEFVEDSSPEPIDEIPESAPVPSTPDIIIQEPPETISDKMLTRDVIVQLRIENGEGSSPSEFSTEFPYQLLE
jgi:hypothetical protein